MALRTDSVKEKGVDEDKTPEYEVRLDFEGKGYLAKKEVVEEPREEVKELVKEVIAKPKRRKKK